MNDEPERKFGPIEMTEEDKADGCFMQDASMYCFDCEIEADDIPHIFSSDATVESFVCPFCGKEWKGINDEEIAESILECKAEMEEEEHERNS